MNQAKKLVFAFLVASAIIIAILAIIAFRPKINPTEFSTNETIFYYGITCPHCKNVEKWMDENNFTKTFNLTQKEVYLNQTNAQELLSVGKICKIQKDYIGAVPLVYSNGTCFLGDTDIINFFKTKIGVK
jgi:glutaredoxin